MDQLALFPDSAVTGSGRPAPWPVAEPEPEIETPVDPDQLAFEEVVFEYDGQRLSGNVISRYDAPSGPRVTVGISTGAVYCLRADSVTPAEGDAA